MSRGKEKIEEKYEEQIGEKIDRLRKTGDESQLVKQIYELEFENRKYRNRIENLENDLRSKEKALNAIDSEKTGIAAGDIEKAFILSASLFMFSYSVISKNIFVTISSLLSFVLYRLHFGKS